MARGCAPSAQWLVVVLYAELDLPRLVGLGASTECTRVDPAIGNEEVGLVERVEELRTELHAVIVSNQRVLRQRQIPVDPSRGLQDVLSGIPKGAIRRLNETRCVEPSVRIALASG